MSRTTHSVNTSQPITAMHIHTGRLPTNGAVGVQLYPSNATLLTYAPSSTLTMVIPVDSAALVTDVFPTFAQFAEVRRTAAPG